MHVAHVPQSSGSDHKIWNRSCLSLIGLTSERRRRPECRILWVAPSSTETYGPEINVAVRDCDNNVYMLNTVQQRRPEKEDMLSLAY